MRTMDEYTNNHKQQTEDVSDKLQLTATGVLNLSMYLICLGVMSIPAVLALAVDARWICLYAAYLVAFIAMVAVAIRSSNKEEKA